MISGRNLDDSGRLTLDSRWGKSN